jgi:hypothetical protein
MPSPKILDAKEIGVVIFKLATPTQHEVFQITLIFLTPIIRYLHLHIYWNLL